MPKTRWQFRPSLLPTLAALVFFPVLLALGNWQLDRADEKKALHAAYSARSAAPPASIGDMREDLDDVEGLRYRRLLLRGTFDTARQYLLDNQVLRGTAGYHVFTPFIPEGETLRVLVNRGWVPAGPDRERPPRIDTPADTLEVLGMIKPPSEPGLILKSAAEETVAPGVLRVPRVDTAAIAAATGWALAPFELRLEPESAGGFAREWPTPGSGRERHLAYAFQWFALAALLVTLYVVLNLKRRA